MPLPLDDQICFTLYATSMAVGRTYQPMLNDLGITYPQYLVLCALGEGGELTIGAIAQRLSLEPSTITPLIKRMEAGRFVARRRDRSDERHVHVQLTDAGHAVLTRCDCLNERLIERSGMTLDQLNQLNRQIQQLRGALIAPEA